MFRVFSWDIWSQLWATCERVKYMLVQALFKFLWDLYICSDPSDCLSAVRSNCKLYTFEVPILKRLILSPHSQRNSFWYQANPVVEHMC